MGNTNSTAVQKCLNSAVGGNADLVAFREKPLFGMTDVRPYNLDIPVTPTAVTYPETVEMVSDIIKCAASNDLKVQPRSGGHSYGNHAIGGKDDAIVIDLKNFKQFSMDNSTHEATIGAGNLLGDVTELLHDSGGRAMAHGTCPQVGIGGHATIGGLGPTSRLWGTALDHILEVEVVLANGTATRASSKQNPDLFWGLRGAAASFGVITEFKVKTEPEPGETVQYSFTFNLGSASSKAQLFKDWQKFVSDPATPRELAAQAIMTPIGMVLYGTYFGSKAEFDKLNIQAKFPKTSNATVVVFDDWLGQVGQWTSEVAQAGGGEVPSHFYAKSLVFTNDTLIPDSGVDKFMQYIDDTDKGTLLWFAIFDLAGGAVNDPAPDATAYGHRDALFYLQSYAINLVGDVSNTTKSFLSGLNDVIIDSTPAVADNGAYAGYVDPEMENSQKAYWGSNLARLEKIKAQVDPGDVFHNPQSVRPAK